MVSNGEKIGAYSTDLGKRRTASLAYTQGQGWGRVPGDHQHSCTRKRWWEHNSEENFQYLQLDEKPVYGYAIINPSISTQICSILEISLVSKILSKGVFPSFPLSPASPRILGSGDSAANNQFIC